MRRIAPLMMLSLAIGGAASAQDRDLIAMPPMRVYVGTYTGPACKGIYLLDFDPMTGALTSPRVAAETPSPSFLAIHPSRKFLYAANEVDEFGGKAAGSVSAFAIDPRTGLLGPLNVKTSGGAHPCYVAVDPAGKVVLTANYSGGNVEALPIESDGRLGDPTSLVKHGERGKSHAHAIDLDASGQVAVAADLGLDKLMVYRLDAEKGTLTPNDPPFAPVANGSGPRHFAFHPDGKHAYCINEKSCTVNAFDYDPAKGTLAEIQALPTRRGEPKPGQSTAEILVHPSGKFVYGSNRGEDNLAIYSVAPASGQLTLVGHQSTGGKTPRSFGIDPTGRFLLAANQNSGTIVVFRVDPSTGLLKQVGAPVAVPTPVCVKFVPIEG